MTNYYTYKETGEIISSGDCPESMIPLQGKPDKGIFVDFGEANWETDYLENGKITKKPLPPSKSHIFNYTTKQWEDPRSLQDFKAAQWNQIKEARAKAEYSGFVWDGSTFDSDAVSQNRITGAVTLAAISSTFTLDWILADNSTRTLNQLEMLQVGAALGNHVAEQFSKGTVLRAFIEAATSREEVEVISWN